jgi:hypothetical protein
MYGRGSFSNWKPLHLTKKYPFSCSPNYKSPMEKSLFPVNLMVPFFLQSLIDDKYYKIYCVCIYMIFLISTINKKNINRIIQLKKN